MSDIDNIARPGPDYRVAAKASHLADTVLGAIAAVVLFAMMAVTAVDVTGRYLFNSPLQGGYEFTQLLMLSLVFAGLPTVTRRYDHVTVGLFNNAFKGRLRIARDVSIAVIVAVAAAYLGWRLYLLGGRFSGFGDTTATVRIPLAPFAYGGAFAMLLTALASVVLLVESFKRGDAAR
jgi:TRAP-type C4-dicarboxylate transport system permease small subunit